MDTTSPIRTDVLNLMSLCNFDADRALTLLCDIYRFRATHNPSDNHHSTVLQQIEYLVRGIYADKDYN
jgi:hypothetical protein